MKYTTLEVLTSKGPNRRQVIGLYKDENNKICIQVRTKRLVDYKERIITESCETYSIETFYVLTDLFKYVYKSEVFQDIVKNEILDKPIYNIETTF